MERNLPSQIAVARLREASPTRMRTPKFTLMARRLSPRLAVAIGLIILIAVAALFAPQIAPYDPIAIRPADRLLAPSSAHLLGTDMYGRDLFSRILYGAQPTLQVALGAVSVGAIPGITLGLLAGSKRSLFDQLLTQVIDAWIALPGVLVALVMVAAFGRSLTVLTLALGVSSIPTFYRVARAETMRVSSELFVEAAVSLGSSPNAVVFRHILPNVMPLLLTLGTLSIGRMLLATSALSFIGLGAPPPSPEWGGLLAEGRAHMETSWWLIWFPGVVIAVTTFAFFLLGNALRDAES